MGTYVTRQLRSLTPLPSYLLPLCLGPCPESSPFPLFLLHAYYQFQPLTLINFSYYYINFY